MNHHSFMRAWRFMVRVFHGEDVAQVRQGKEQWERQFIEGGWDRLRNGQPNTQRIAQLIFDEASKSEGTISVLDVGCGNGGLAVLINRMPEHVTYVGIDVSEVAVAEAMRLAPRGTYYAMDAEHPNAHLGTFDIIVFNEVIYYMNAAEVMPRYRAHARDGTKVIVSVHRSWRSPFVWHRVRSAMRILDRHCVSMSSLTSGKFHVWDIRIGTL